MGMSRRKFLKSGTLAGVGLLVTACARKAASPGAGTQGNAVRVAKLDEVKPWVPVSFEYPGKGEKALLIDVGEAVDGGVGPNQSIIAVSGLCQHMGCPLDFREDQKLLVCPCHASVFDPLKLGHPVEGPTTRGLPLISLEVSAEGTITATGVSSGVVYGRASNL